MTIIYYYKDGCPFCDDFDPEWQEFSRNKKDKYNCKKIKYSDNIDPIHKSKITGVPAVFIGGVLTNRNKLKDM